jgi:hypothetical protein
MFVRIYKELDMNTKPPTVPQRVFDVYYADLRRSVVMEADLDRGWEKLEKTYGFFRQTPGTCFPESIR